MQGHFWKSHFLQLPIAVSLVSEFRHLEPFRANHLKTRRNTKVRWHFFDLNFLAHNHLFQKRTMTSRLISKIRGIRTTMEVVAKKRPTVPPFWASHQDHSLETWNPCWKEFPARVKNPLRPPSLAVLLDDDAGAMLFRVCYAVVWCCRWCCWGGVTWKENDDGSIDRGWILNRAARSRSNLQCSKVSGCGGVWRW